MHFFNPSGVDRKTNIWGNNILGGILACTNRAKANTIGITMVPYRKHVRNPADWTFFSVLSIGEFGESKKNGEKSRRDKHIFGHPQKNNTSMVLGSGFWVLGLGARKAQGPDLAPGPVKQTFL